MARTWSRTTAGLVLVLGVARHGHAATIAVGSTADENAGSPPNAACTLREALLAANANAAIGGCVAGDPAPVVDVVSVPAGTYELTLGGAGEEAGATGDLDVTGAVRIETADVRGIEPSGDGPFVTIDQLTGDRVLDVLPGASVVSVDVAFVGGELAASAGGDAQGGGIRNRGALTLTRCSVAGNVATGGAGTFPSHVDGGAALGGGLFASGPLVLDRTPVQGNVATGGDGSGGGAPGKGGRAAGGGIYGTGAGALLSIVTSSVSGNQASGGEGGLVSSVGGAGGAADGGAIGAAVPLYVVDSSIDGNVAEGGLGGGITINGGAGGRAAGGAIHALAPAYVGRSTLAGNTALGGLGELSRGPGGAALGGAIYAGGSSLTLENVTLPGNAATGGNAGDDESLGISGISAEGGDASGGAVHAESGTLTLVATTFAGNAATGGAGGDADPDGLEENPGPGGDALGGTLRIVTGPGGATVSLATTILRAGAATAGTGGAPDGASGTASGDDCLGVGIAATQGGNVESPGNTCALRTADPFFDQVNVTTEALALGSLGSNGGPTDTMRLVAASVAIDTAPPALCPAVDQRGYGRDDGACDAGAYEYAAVAAIFVDGLEAGSTGAWPGTVAP